MDFLPYCPGGGCVIISEGGEKMNIFGACSLFAVIIFVYLTIAEIFTVLFRFTGLPEEKARFQVVSLLTGSGFTTRESELVVSTSSRRRLARITMMFGYVFNITIVSAFVNVFLSLKLVQIEDFVWSMPVPLVLTVAFIILQRVRVIRSWEDAAIERLARRIAHRGGGNSVMLLDYIGGDALAQVSLADVPEALRDRPLADTGLKSDYSILVLLLERRGGKPVPAAADTVFLPGDKLTVFGDYASIASAFHAAESFGE